MAPRVTRVYLAGPYSKPDPCENTHRAIKMADELLDLGYVPFVPHLTHLWHTVSPKSYRAWLNYDAYWVPLCDVLFRLPGASSGADAEMQLASKHGIPVVHSIADLQQKFPISRDTVAE